jgi:hypothetical protein
MTAGRLRLAPLALAALISMLAGCGHGSVQHTPDLARLPLVGGSRIVNRAIRCDKGANAFCGWELVVVAPHYRSSEALLQSEHRRLLKLGWTGATGDTSEQKAADSPGHKLRVTYATAYGDLTGIDLGWIKRSRTVTLALSRAMFAHSPTLSMLLEEGAS